MEGTCVQTHIHTHAPQFRDFSIVKIAKRQISLGKNLGFVKTSLDEFSGQLSIILVPAEIREEGSHL